MEEKAKTYLESIVAPLTKSGVEILSEKMPRKPDEPDFEGVSFAIIPKNPSEVGHLLGAGGEHVDAVRTLMRVWSGVHTSDALHIILMVANSKRIKTEHI